MTETTKPCAPPVHWENPWTEAVPVPLEELAVCVAGGTIGTPEGSKAYTVDYVLESWRRFGERLDGYLLSGGGHISVGVRYGAEGEKYLSPHCQDEDTAWALIRKYRPESDDEEEETPPPAP